MHLDVTSEKGMGKIAAVGEMEGKGGIPNHGEVDGSTMTRWGSMLGSCRRDQYVVMFGNYNKRIEKRERRII